MRGKLKKKQGPYRARLTVTADADALPVGSAKRGKPVRVDPMRFDAWLKAGLIEVEEEEVADAQ